MLPVNTIRLIAFAKHTAFWKKHASDAYCRSQIYRDRCKNAVQALVYSTTCDAREDISRCPVDPRIEALRNKLIYCDHLDHYKVRMSYAKRMSLKKRVLYAEKKERVDRLVNEPVYSVLLDGKRNENDMREKHAEGDVKVPVHMPYASTDRFSNVEIPRDDPDEAELDVNAPPLSDKYKVLYDKYLAEKSAALVKGEEVTLQDYLEKMETDVSHRADLSDVPINWMNDIEQFDDTLQDNIWFNNYGTPDPNSSVSSVPCGGCGALLHCKDQAIPGYMPSELFTKRRESELRVMICQRCHFMKYYNTTLEVKVSADEYPKLLKVIRTKKCAVIMMVDITDFPCSIWPEINSVLHPMTPIFVVGNKVDLLPQDSKNFLDHVKQCLLEAVKKNTGIREEMIRHVSLISAKSGYGVEELINKLLALWKYKGDVYVIGCTNVGKSSLFNALLQSDYCKVQATDLIERATISPWPGTTLNLLKFPIINPQKWRLYLRMLRLRKDRAYERMEEALRTDTFKTTRHLKYATLQGQIGRTFETKSKNKDPSKDPFAAGKYCPMPQFFNENKEEYKYSRWCYDTPGTIHSDQVLDLLTTRELLSVLPEEIISPRTFLLRVNQTLLLGGIGRLDYLRGDDFIRCTVFSSGLLPITITHTTDADSVYNELLKTEAFVVPENNPERLKHWPALESKEMEVTGKGKSESAADVVLSSAGWIAITSAETERVLLRAWSPQGRGLHLRIPALLRKSVTLRGDRVSITPAYRSGYQAYKKT